MNRLTAELQRLYLIDDRQWRGREAGDGVASAAFDLAAADGRVRAMLVIFLRAGDWEAVAGLCQGVQEDLDLPAPAVSVSGQAGYRVWFSLAEPVPSGEAHAFLERLRRRYLAELPAAALDLRPAGGEAGPEPLDLVPAVDAATGKWSAFIDPAMGSMFVAEPGLEMAPNLDRQADLLAGLESIKADDFRGALEALRQDGGHHPDAPAEAPGEPGGRPRPPGAAPALNVGGGFSDPKSFLLAVMNDSTASAGDRIAAARALLPYFERPPAQ